jgi:hypothetical protein
LESKYRSTCVASRQSTIQKRVSPKIGNQRSSTRADVSAAEALLAVNENNRDEPRNFCSRSDVHIAQFAALLRTLAKSLRRQVIIAVHHRALFDYLTLELSPALEDDRLITVQLSRTFSGDSVGVPKVMTFKRDDAIAA